MKPVITKECEACYKIICRQCGWTACDADVQKIRKGILTSCPDCGWRPDNKAI